MYKNINEISADVKESVRKDYLDGYLDIRTMKKKYEMFRNEILAIVGQVDAKVEDYPDGVIGSPSFVALSDLHIGSIYEKTWYYEYLADFLSEYGIRDVVVAGDSFQGKMPPLQERYENPNVQVKHVTEVIPEVDKVTWHILFGNHELSILGENDKYLRVLKTRKDFHFLGFKRAYMLFGTHLFSIAHKTPKYRIDAPAVNADFRLTGHGHYEGVNDLGIHLPPFCLDTKNGTSGSPYPGFVVARRYNSEIVFFYYMFDEKVSKNTTTAELKKIKERKLVPMEMGRILSIPR